METFFREFGIYSSKGQNYEPVDSGSLLYYKETTDGQILEEGLTEAGSFSSFIASGTSLTHTGVATIPFFIFYSMFGLQRVGDLAWAAGDARTRGFLIGATAGRTTLNGEGLQHQDGHSHVLSSVIPTMVSYDPAYAYEISVLVREGIRRMHDENEDVTFYLTVTNENYRQPPIPDRDGVREGIIQGMYLFRSAEELGAELGIDVSGHPRTQLLGSGAILNEALAAQEMLLRDYGVAPDVWSVTSYSELRREAMDVERWNWLHPTQERRLPYVTRMLGDDPTLVVGATDYLKSLPDSIAKWVDAPLVALGTDGYGRSATRAELRDFFEVDARHIAFATLSALVRDEAIAASVVQQAMDDLKINPERPNPATL